MKLKITRVPLIFLTLWFTTTGLSNCHAKVSKLVDVTNIARYPFGVEALRLGTLPLEFPVIENAAFNPMVIANKKDKNNFLVVCSQGGNINFLADLAVFSTDGGKTWNQPDLVTGRAQGPTLHGAPNDYVSPTDPFATSDKLGNLYFAYAAIQIVNRDGSSNFGNALNFTKSKNRGISWNAIDSIENNLTAPQSAFVDRPTITADPCKKNTVYAVWGNVVQALDPSLPQTFELQISRDGGNTWSTPKTIATLDVGVYGFNPILHILPDHSAVIIYQSNNPNGTFDIITLKSKDLSTWKRHVVYKHGIMARASDPDDPSLFYATYVLGVDSKLNQKTGDLYITWADAKANPSSTPELPAAGVFIARSTDGGKSFSAPIVANPTTLGVQTFSQAIAIAENGTIGVSFYDFRKYKDHGNSDANLKTNLWLAVFDSMLKHRLDEIRLTPTSFDARKFTFFPGQGWEISDFGTIDATGNEFLMAYPVTNPPFGGGPIIVAPGEIFTGLPTNIKFVKASLDAKTHKLEIKAMRKPSQARPNKLSEAMFDYYMERLRGRFVA